MSLLESTNLVQTSYMQDFINDVVNTISRLEGQNFVLRHTVACPYRKDRGHVGLLKFSIELLSNLKLKVKNIYNHIRLYGVPFDGSFCQQSKRILLIVVNQNYYKIIWSCATENGKCCLPCHKQNSQEISTIFKFKTPDAPRPQMTLCIHFGKRRDLLTLKTHA